MEFLAQHYTISFAMLIVWILTYWYGKKIDDNDKVKFGYFLIGISIVQEFADYIGRYYGSMNGLYDFQLLKELPLQPCHFAYFSLLLAIYTRKQIFFDIGYFFGISGALLGIITPGNDGIYSLWSNLTAHFQHSFIIMNIMWCISALKMGCTKRSILNAFLFLNIMIIPIGLFDMLTGQNYFFLMKAPELLVYNPLLPITTWPWYILWIEFIFFPYCYIFYLAVQKD